MAADGCKPRHCPTIYYGNDSNMKFEPLFQEFIDGVQTATDEASFAKVATRTAHQFGFQRFAYLRLTNGIPFLVSSYPKSWTNRYFDLNYQNIDPVVRRASREHDVFGWGGSEAKPPGSRAQRRLFDEATTFGINSGITVPIRGGFGATAAFTLASSEPLASNEKLAAESKEAIRLVALYFHTHLTVRQKLGPLLSTEESALTQRELQCLAWTSRGKTVADVALLVGVKPRTVVFHLENARRKVAASSIAQCVAEAVRRGLLP